MILKGCVSSKKTFVHFLNPWCRPSNPKMQDHHTGMLLLAKSPYAWPWGNL